MAGPQALSHAIMQINPSSRPRRVLIALSIDYSTLLREYNRMMFIPLCGGVLLSSETIPLQGRKRISGLVCFRAVPAIFWSVVRLGLQDEMQPL